MSTRSAGERASREKRCRYISQESKWRCEVVEVRQEKWMQHYSSVEVIVGAAVFPALFSEPNRPQLAAGYRRLIAQEGTKVKDQHRGKVKEIINVLRKNAKEY